jgi:tellurite methyltransferase
MSEADREHWDRRHRSPRTNAPSPALAWLPPGRGLALDLACGQGRNSVALADAGYRVVAADVSRHALAWIVACDGGEPRIHRVQMDTDAWCFSDRAFDVIVQCDFLDRRLLDRLPAALRDGGLILVDTFMRAAHANAEGPTNPDYLLDPDEIERRFAGLEILRSKYAEGPTCRAAILARKPAHPRHEER